MAKNIVKTIPLEEETLNYIQALFEDYNAKRDLITMMFELHKFDDDYSIITSTPFKAYEKEFAKSKIMYDTAMQEIQERLIPDEFKSEKYNFEVKFDEQEIQIYE